MEKRDLVLGKDVGLKRFDEETHALCVLEFKYRKSYSGMAAFHCKVHGQNLYVFPISRTWHYKKLESLTGDIH